VSTTDGAILFFACLLSFAGGYLLGALRLSRFVRRELTKVHIELAQHRQGLDMFISKLGNDPDNKH